MHSFLSAFLRKNDEACACQRGIFNKYCTKCKKNTKNLHFRSCVRFDLMVF